MKEKPKTGLIELDCCWNCTNRRLLTIDEAAAACAVSTNTVYVWMKRGDIEWVYNPGGKRLIYWDSLVRGGLVVRADLAPLAPPEAA
jgi:excisionase family DNA binding protein